MKASTTLNSSPFNAMVHIGTKLAGRVNLSDMSSFECWSSSHGGSPVPVRNFNTRSKFWLLLGAFDQGVASSSRRLWGRPLAAKGDPPWRPNTALLGGG